MKKRILQISNYYSPEIGGIEKIAQAISSSVSDLYEVRVVCFTHGKKNVIESVDGIRVYRYGTELKVASQQISLLMVSAIRTILRDYSPDIVIIHLPNPYLEWILMKYIDPKCKLVVYWHSDIVKQRIGEKLLASLTKKILVRSDVIVATSPNYIDGSKYLRQFRKKCIVIPNCIDEDRLSLNDRIMEKAKSIRSKNEGKKLLICVGRQVPYKGFEYAIQAVKKLPDNYVLYILGREGKSTKLLKKLADKCERIHFEGEVDDDSLYAYMVACDLFCFPSVTKNEAFGIALAEGMYFGKPAVTFTIEGSGVNYVNLSGKTGVEVPNRDIDAYSKAIKTICDNNEMKQHFGEAAAERVRALFLQSGFKMNILKLLKSL